MSTCPPIVNFGVPAENPTAFYTITFEGKTVQNGQSTWCYNVTVVGDPALSHWVLGAFELCPELLEERLLSVTRNGIELEENSDYVLGTSDGVFGVKFEIGTSAEDNSVEYCITVEGDYEPTAVDVAVKGGPTPAQRREDALCGPSCIEMIDPVNNLLESIALEEIALAHIINSEAEKIQEIVGAVVSETEEPMITVDELLDLQDSVNDTLKTTIKKQILLQFKLEDLLDFKEETETS